MEEKLRDRLIDGQIVKMKKILSSSLKKALKMHSLRQFRRSSKEKSDHRFKKIQKN